MPAFTYSARDNSGAAINGTLVAESLAQATQMIRAEGKYPTAIRAASPAAEASRFFPRGLRMSRKDLIHVATQLSIMVDTGVTLSEALECIATQSEKPTVRKIVHDVFQEVQSGADFSSALQKHPRAFPRMFIALI